tara:strand:+ start:158 stop:373 length:216 start_codon:yes stop_codon:yes gene_type:complete
MDFKFRIVCDDCNGEGYLEEFRQGSDVIVDCWECETKGWHEMLKLFMKVRKAFSLIIKTLLILRWYHERFY